MTARSSACPSRLTCWTRCWSSREAWSPGDLRAAKLPHAFAAAPAEHADLLVITPGAERFEDFRYLERVAEATLPHVLG